MGIVIMAIASSSARTVCGLIDKVQNQTTHGGASRMSMLNIYWPSFAGINHCFTHKKHRKCLINTIVKITTPQSIAHNPTDLIDISIKEIAVTIHTAPLLV